MKRVLTIPDCTIGGGAVSALGETLQSLGVSRVMVVTDRGIVKAGIFDKLAQVLGNAKIAFHLYDQVQADPSIVLVQAAVAEARSRDIEAVVGLGGGSSIDTAKIVAALHTNACSVQDIIGADLLATDPLPLIAVPTTAGTGSEATHIAIVTDEEAELKKSIVSRRIIPRFAFLDPDLTLGLPPSITAATGMDALCHAIESYTSVNATEFSEALSLQAIGLLSANITIAFQAGGNVEAREKMLLGSLIAGIAFANAGVTAVHAFAYPLGCMYHVAHGLANALMLPTIMRFNISARRQRFADVGRALAGCREPTADAAVARVEELSKQLQLPRNLAAIGIPEDSLLRMAESAVQNSRLLKNNPRHVTLQDAFSLYQEAFSR
jgi:alcohol dehydrogenase